MSDVWIQTWSGVAFDLLEPEPSMVNPTDICVALGRICRFTGHCSSHYSVAEHCMRLVNLNLGVWHDELAVHLLLHDAAEAYLGDISSPLKGILGQTVRQMEMVILSTIYEALAVPHPTSWCCEVVRKLDMRMLATERQHLLGECVREWDSMVGVEPFQGVDMLTGRLSEREATTEYHEALKRLVPGVR